MFDSKEVASSGKVVSEDAWVSWQARRLRRGRGGRVGVRGHFDASSLLPVFPCDAIAITGTTFRSDQLCTPTVGVFSDVQAMIWSV